MQKRLRVHLCPIWRSVESWYILFLCPEADFFGVESLCKWIAEEIERFNEAYSTVEMGATPQNLGNLVTAADRLMRAVARVLIEAKRRSGDNN